MNVYFGLLLSAATGILIGISGTYNGIFAWAAFVPILIALDNASAREVALYGACGGICAAALLYYGVISYGLQYYIALIIYTALQGVVAAIGFAALSNRLKNNFLNYLISPLIWVGIEYLRTISSISFPSPLGVTQHQFLSLMQVSALTGIYGITLLILWVNRLAAVWVVELFKFKRGGIKIKKGLSDAFLTSALVSAVLFGAVCWGHGLLKKNPSEEEGIKVSIVQGNIPMEFYRNQHDVPSKKDAIRNRYFGMTARALREEAPRLLVWPESAIDEKIIEIDGYRKKILDYAKVFGSFIIIGSPGTDEAGFNTNSAYVISDQGEIIGRYDKVKLIPFLENYGKGRGYFPIQTDLGKIGIVICFESAYPQALRELVRRGAAVLFVLTNDCGFGDSPISSMHANDAAIRAIENRRYLVLANQRGVSLMIDPFGRILRKYGGKEPKILSGKVNLRKEITLYNTFGDYLPLLSILICLLTILRKRHPQ